MDFSERLKSLRVENGYTQKDLAKILGISYQGIQKYERGISHPRLGRLEELAILFDVSISYLIGETDVRTPSKLSNVEIFSKRLKLLRLEAGYTQKELAQKLGMTGAGYSKYGTGIETTHPRIERLQKIAEVFNVSVSYLLGETDTRPLGKQVGPLTFPERLRFLRTSAGYSQADVAKKLGLTSSQAYSNYERGVNKPQKDTLQKIAEIFNVSVDYLLCKTDNQSDN
ncbi:MAG: helix-turn-helix domain-containing protein [Rickettsiales bacterium]|jgi:transcriptional regulator with XRE-family HTH domain|nr:helix-turn-helix domain-containing protein [Rickettsiales bacterium]